MPAVAFASRSDAWTLPPSAVVMDVAASSFACFAAWTSPTSMPSAVVVSVTLLSAPLAETFVAVILPPAVTSTSPAVAWTSVSVIESLSFSITLAPLAVTFPWKSLFVLSLAKFMAYPVAVMDALPCAMTAAPSSWVTLPATVTVMSLASSPVAPADAALPPVPASGTGCVAVADVSSTSVIWRAASPDEPTVPMLTPLVVLWMITFFSVPEKATVSASVNTTLPSAS